MKAWVVHEFGPPERMRFEELPTPQPSPASLQIQVEAAGLNFFDALLVAGTYQVKPALPFIPGSEIAGTVLAAPPGSRFNPGDRVLAAVRQDGLTQGGYAEVTAADPANTNSLPDGMPFDDAAAFYIAYQTAWVGLHRRAQLRPGEVLLIHAGAGGVGSAAIQLGKAAGARVIATASSSEKVSVCRDLGADLAIDYSTDDFVAQVKEFTDGRGADVIWDPVGGDVLERSTKCIAFEGRLIAVGFTSGQFPAIRANHVLIKNYAVLGLHWGLYRQVKPDVIAEATEALFGLYRDRKIRPYISARRPLSDGAAALAAIASRQTTGKVVLIPTR